MCILCFSLHTMQTGSVFVFLFLVRWVQAISITYIYTYILMRCRETMAKLAYSQVSEFVRSLTCVCARARSFVRSLVRPHNHTNTGKTVKTNKLVIGIMVIQLISFRVCVWSKGMRNVKTFVRLHAEQPEKWDEWVKRMKTENKREREKAKGDWNASAYIYRVTWLIKTHSEWNNKWKQCKACTPNISTSGNQLIGFAGMLLCSS